ncbi:Rho GTPase activation protein [Dichotomocladium elegans]|nr:Rho GTPase activation protein [Dichotomocladium elegans]
MLKLSRRKSLGSWIKRGASASSANNNSHRDNRDAGVFGVPLVESIQYAGVTMRYTDDAREHARAGRIPLVIAKCGAFLKSQALWTENIFLRPGNVRHVDELQFVFDDRQQGYGVHVLWKPSYTVHDAAALLLRYLDHIPDSVVPQRATEAFLALLAKGDTHDEIAFRDVIHRTLAPPHQHLLHYLIDLLSLVACNAHHNHMDAGQLANLFGPRILRHAKDRNLAQILVRRSVEFHATLIIQKHPVSLMAPRPIRPILINAIASEATSQLAKMLGPTSSAGLVPMERHPSNEEAGGSSRPHFASSKAARRRATLTQESMDDHVPIISTPVIARVWNIPIAPATGIESHDGLQQALNSFRSKSTAYRCWTAAMISVAVVVTCYETYQVLWAQCVFEPIFFLVGFGLYCILLVRGIPWSHHPFQRQRKTTTSDQYSSMKSLRTHQRD